MVHASRWAVGRFVLSSFFVLASPVPVGAAPPRFVAVTGAGPSNENYALNSCGDLFTAPDGSCTSTLCTRIPTVGQTFASLGRNASGNWYAISESGQISVDASAQNDCHAWSLCAQLFGDCPGYVAIVGSGPGNQNYALNSCGDVFVALDGTCGWSLCTRIPAKNDPFVSIGRNASGNFYALTRSGQIWRAGTPTNDCHSWTPCGALTPGSAPYAAIVGAGPSNANLAISEGGDVYSAQEGACAWGLCGHISANGRFVSIARNASGHFYALTDYGEMFTTDGCAEWSACGHLSGGCTTLDAGDPRDEPGLSVTPNPGRDHVVVQFSTHATGPVDLAIFDAMGRRRATLFQGVVESGRHQATWSRRDTNGAPARPGVFFVRLAQRSGTMTRRFVFDR